MAEALVRPVSAGCESGKVWIPAGDERLRFDMNHKQEKNNQVDVGKMMMMTDQKVGL